MLLAALPACEARFLGDGAVAYRDLLVSRRGPGCLAGTGPWFLARAVSLWGASRLGKSGGEVPLPVPLYLRPSDAEVGRGRTP